MKIIAFILATFVLAMSTITYCVDDDCPAENENLSINHDFHEDDDCNNCCSPFLSCHTCTGFTVPVISLELNFPTVENFKHSTSIYRETISEFSVHIWQPPKLV